MTEITYQGYNKQSFAVFGDRSKYGNLIKSVGGRWNARLKNFPPGWIVPRYREAELAKIITEKPDIVILDVIMPKKNGFEVLTELKERGLISQIPVIVFSHLVQTEDQAKARSLGAVDYLNKDTTNFESMYQAIASHIPIATTV
jgi:CheY-like chemotaxis protein